MFIFLRQMFIITMQTIFKGFSSLAFKHRYGMFSQLET